MLDYSSLSDEQINKLIAERRGWHDFGVADFWTDDDTVGPEKWTEMVATAPDGDEYRLVPSWATDLNAAAELLKDTHSTVQCTEYIGGEWRVDAFFLNRTTDSDNLPRAIAIDWLQWTDAHPTPAMRKDAAAS